MAGSKSGKTNKVALSLYDLVKKSKSKLYAILMVLLGFSKSLNIVTDSIYRKHSSTYSNH